MEWIDVKDRLPQKEGKILVLLGESIFLINARLIEHDRTNVNLDKIYCNIYKRYEFEKPTPQIVLLGTNLKNIVTYTVKFIKPSHYKEITHWCEVPELPKEIKND